MNLFLLTTKISVGAENRIEYVLSICFLNYLLIADADAIK